MHTIKISFVLFTSIALLTNCETQSSEKSNKHSNTEQTERHDAHQPEKAIQELKLNDGKKWQVNAEMMVPVRKMENRIAQFNKNQGTDYQKLAEEMKTDLDQLTSSCTMTGESHDQLHLWLLPHIELVDKLKDKFGFEKIQKSMETFNRFFE
jgi:major membrane immunogen (membrane-anchored lipoprotein)